ncbi:MAG TPA: dihydrofolate reductase family protein [Flexivirga sp.]|uniref:dihydrofolate reductase family protein n=1 Tax=Flexivirga sp. TaxID=1962927 RepID=UPI002BF52BED|nr:dihydrofolate reductase family protein [Flexivirga sp.]HWC24381.1 dihydrofolate reductase family protein [Flexivirga sp.]
MGKLVLYSICSLDGAVDDPTRLFPPSDTTEAAPPEFEDAMEGRFRQLIGAQTAVLLGRGMYDEWARFWPTSDDFFADFINNIPKYIVTSSPLDGGWTNAEPVSGPLAQIVADLKARTTGDVGVHGSITLAQELLAEGLVDELQLTVAPVLDPVGRRLTERVTDLTPLTLIDSLVLPSGAMWLTYRISAS